MEKLNKEKILKTLHDYKSEIRNLGVKKIILFGSYARDEQKKTSDIDFLVEFEKDKYNIDNHLNLLYLLENLFKKKIDIIKPHFIRNELKDDILGGIKHVAKI
jgi:uncharacterized protein